MLLVGTQAHALFIVARRGNPVSADSVSVRVFRNGQRENTLPVALNEVETGVYAVSFEVLAEWSAGDSLSATLEAVVAGRRAQSAKTVGVVADEASIDRVADLLEADQVIENGELIYRRAGTDVVLMRKAIAGSTCSDNVSLTEP